LKQSAVLGSGLWAAGGALSLGVAGANEKVVLGVMGANGRGNDLAHSFVALPGVEVGYVCDVDERAVGKGLAAVKDRQANPPKVVKDFRRILEDKAVDALVIATPDHWHGPATILACAAGKHVYVEKPASHNPREGELMVAAARKHRRVVQVGTQRRSMPAVVEGIEKLRAGAIGRVLFSRSWYNSTRGSIGRGKLVAAPPWLDYALWQGPVPERPYRDNVVHYNWHWFWHWGTGELGNNGIHGLDLSRWGLGVDCPRRVTAGGGRYHFDDDQETPDTHVVTFDFGDKAISWEGRSCQRHGYEGSMFGAAFYGDQGTLVIDGSGYKVFDAQDKEAGKVPGSGSDAPHLQNFLDGIRSGARLNADVEEGHKSTQLCHLGNIAYRTGHVLNLDPKTGQISGDKAAAALWRRDYRPGWEPRV
jgi:predicted dehydrogenase